MRHCAPRFVLRLALVMVKAMMSLRRTQTRREVRSESMDAICILCFSSDTFGPTNMSSTG